MFMSVVGQFIFFNADKAKVFFVPDYKKHFVAVPNVQQRKIVVKAVCYNHAPFEQWDIMNP